MKALILGALDNSGNIGDVIDDNLNARGWTTATSDCEAADGSYAVPEPNHMISFDSLVVTLGWATHSPFESVEAETVEAVIKASLTLPLLAIRSYVQGRAELGGQVVVIGSYGHDHVLSNSAPYCAAKAGLNHAIKALAWDLTPLFLFWCVNPYHVPATPLGEATVNWMIKERGLTRAEAEDYQRKDLRMDTHLEPEDIAEQVYHLLSEPTSAWLSGSSLDLYGGVR